MLKATKSPKEFVDAAKHFRCESCTVNKPIATRHKVAPPRPYTINYELGVDVLDIKDANDTHYNLLNVVCHGTSFQQAYVVRVADIHGVPSSSSCLNAFTRGWVKWAGWPKQVACDRGLHNRGIFGKTLSSKGIRIRPAALESPEHIGRTERRGDLLKKMMKKVITETKAVGEDAIEMILAECLNAINELARHGGFAPVQWVLNKFPRSPATHGDEKEAHDIGTIQAHVDANTAFADQAKYRFIARKSFIKWDCGQRMQRALLRNAAPVPGPYAVGDVVSYCRGPRAGESGLQWSIGSQTIG
jgi:hypothetical protein